MGLRPDLIDMSNYQAGLVISWPDAKKAGVRGGWLKATEGTGYVNPDYARRKQEFYDNGVVPGAYHFARPTLLNAVAEAEWFLKHADIKPGDLRPALDLEVNTGNLNIDQLTTWVDTWFATVFAAIGQRKGVLYTHFNLSRKPHGSVGIWVPRYSNANWSPVVPRPWRVYTVWQFTDGVYGNPSMVPGVGHVDASTFHRGLGWLTFSWLRLSGKTPPPPPPPPIKPLDKAVLLNPANYPSAAHPNNGAHGPHIKWLGDRLIGHKSGDHFTNGSSSDWSEETRLNVQEFQRKQGWTGGDADGYPGAETLRRLSITYRPPPKESPVAKLLRLAGAKVGYHEGRSGGHWNNVQMFSPAVPGLAWSQGQPWCATFVSWTAMVAGLAAYYPRTASCVSAMAWWKARNEWHEYPAIGAQVIYGNGAHTGIVENWDADYIYTIEGNTNNNGSAEGDGVYRKKRRRRDPYVTGYGYPSIPGVRLHSADPNY